MSGVTGPNYSGESHSITISEGLVPAIRRTTLTEPTMTTPRKETEELDELPVHRLKRALSTRSVVQRAASRPGSEREDLRAIGLGSCGTVFEIPGTELAYKKGTNSISIWTDFNLTNRVHNAVTQVRTMMQEAFRESTIPRTPLCHEFHTADDEYFWSANVHRIPAGHRTKQPLFMVDRILPLPQRTRTDLIEEYFDQDEDAQHEAKNDQDNKDCLVRLYLGERESALQQAEVYDSLRNFPLRLNMMEELDLEVAELASEMAIGLAIVHWQAQVDGMDMEFVLGSSATRDSERPKGYDEGMDTKPHTVLPVSFKRRAVHVWMLDFDKSTKIELTRDDVDTKLVPAFLGNDPYYPRPLVDEELWEDFCKSYLKASGLILRSKGVNKEVMRLPLRFLDEVVRVSKEHEDWNEEDNIVFRA